MKGLLYLFLAGMLVVGVLKDATKDDMAVIQAKNSALGASWRANSDKKNRCTFERYNDITLRICG